MGNGPEQRLATGCSFIASIHDASLTTLTSEEWRIPTTGQTVRHLSLAGAPLIYPLSACSFEEQVVGRLHGDAAQQVVIQLRDLVRPHGHVRGMSSAQCEDQL